jgi:hypothetical protein
VEYKLTKPIKRESGDMLSVLKMRAPEDQCLGDWLWVEASIRADNALERKAMAICRFAGLTRAEVEQLCLADFVALTGGPADPKEAAPTISSSDGAQT